MGVVAGDVRLNELPSFACPTKGLGNACYKKTEYLGYNIALLTGKVLRVPLNNFHIIYIVSLLIFYNCVNTRFKYS